MKKLVFYVLIALLLISTAFAADIDIIVNGQNLDQPIKLEGGTTAKFVISIAKGVMIKNVEVKSNVAIFGELLKENINLQENKVYAQDSIEESYVNLPNFLPAGNYDIHLIIDYQKEGQNQTFEKNVPANMPSTGILSDVAGVIVKILPINMAFIKFLMNGGWILILIGLLAIIIVPLILIGKGHRRE